MSANMPSRTTARSVRSEKTASSLTAYARPIKPKSDMEIRLNHHYKAKTYTSSSPIEGEVTITTSKNVRFEQVEIVLLGISRTRTEGYSTPHESTHTFLKLTMPIPESAYPSPRVLEAGSLLTIPFNFVLPSFLTINACNHKIQSDHLRQQHLQLPPSLGAWARGNWEKDDLSPNMAEVTYSIKARVWAPPEGNHKRPTKAMEAVKSIQVLPAFPEDAPLSISWEDRLYQMHKTKTIRKNILSSKLGTLSVSGTQPRAVVLRPDGRVAIPSQVQLDLSFDAVSADVRPPRVTSVTTKIHAHTFYSSSPIRTAPHSGEWMRQAVAERRGEYATSVNLPTDTPAQLSWHAAAPASISRRDSGYGSDACSEDSASAADCEPDSNPPRPEPTRRRSLAGLLGRPAKPSSSPSSSCAGSPPSSFARPLAPQQPARHIASLQIPLTLPTARKTFLPTFHSCIVSRVYTLQVTLAFGSGSSAAGGATSTPVTLYLPLQIALDAGHGAGVSAAGGVEGGFAEVGEELPSFEDAFEDAAVDELLAPRMLGVPPAEYREPSVSVLPEYARR